MHTSINDENVHVITKAHTESLEAITIKIMVNVLPIRSSDILLASLGISHSFMPRYMVREDGFKVFLIPKLLFVQVKECGLFRFNLC